MGRVSTEQYVLVKKASFVLVILILIWLVGDETFSVWDALDNHDPSARIFRSLFQVNLVIFGAAFSLYVWSKYIQPSMTANLLFAPVFPGSVSRLDDDSASFYSTVDFWNEDEEEEEEGDEEEDGEEVLQEDLAFDAAYASDGEVTPPPRTASASSASSSTRALRKNGFMKGSPRSTLPTPTQVTHIALDLLLKIVITLFLYTVSSSSPQSTDVWRIFSRVTAPTFPLLLFCYLSYRLFFPWKKRKAFILVIYTTLAAPWYPVTFRDGFIGDILTSIVRPLQDISFTVLYVLFGMRSWYTADYRQTSFIDHADASVPVMERSWLLHTVVLPMCMVSPLWYRFLQNLRQTHDNRRRWPYLGNALKYFAAASVAMVGVFNPSQKGTFLWLGSFVMATLYQIWWDVFMDWSMLERRGGRWQLRQKRLYSKKYTYWTIFGINFALRFCWTLSFLPLRYLDAAGVLTNNFKGDLHAFFGPTIATAEIIRRTLWGLLRVEWEAIQVDKSIVPKSISDQEAKLDDKNREPEEADESVEMIPMNMQGVGGMTIPLSSKAVPSIIDMSSMDHVQVLLELGLYAAAFCAIGLIAAAHRGTF